jgi:hypothetical protein
MRRAFRDGGSQLIVRQVQIARVDCGKPVVERSRSQRDGDFRPRPSPAIAASVVHNRMPVVLKPETWPVWLGEAPADASRLKVLLAPFPSEQMACWPVSARVGNVKNNDPGLIEPIAA